MFLFFFLKSRLRSRSAFCPLLTTCKLARYWRLPLNYRSCRRLVAWAVKRSWFLLYQSTQVWQGWELVITLVQVPSLQSQLPAWLLSHEANFVFVARFWTLGWRVLQNWYFLVFGCSQSQLFLLFLKCINVVHQFVLHVIVIIRTAVWLLTWPNESWADASVFILLPVSGPPFWDLWDIVYINRSVFLVWQVLLEKLCLENWTNARKHACLGAQGIRACAQYLRVDRLDIG